MEEFNDSSDPKTRTKWKYSKRSGVTSSPSIGYCLGFIGAAVYFVQQATTFWMGVLGILEATVWPAFLIYHLMQFLHV